MIPKILRARLLLTAGMAAVLLAACGQAAAPPPPTRTPAPTFTPTPVGAQAADPNAPVAPPAADAGGSATTSTDAGQPAAPVQSTSVFSDVAATPAVEAAPPVEAAPTVAPTNTPAPANPQVTLTQIVNVRGGPGTNYNVLGAGNPGQVFPVTGKSPAGDWWQINFNGQSGWVFGQLVTPLNTESVAVAANIPPAPTAPPPPPATNTPVPQPTQPPAAAQPTAAPAPSTNYRFNVAVVGRCDRQPAGNWFEGKTYVNGVPQSGYKVVFSYAPDGPWSTPPVVSGPHAGYEGWDQGYYSHIINATGPQAGNWFVWVVDDTGARISEIANWQSTGPGEGCNQAVVDFDSR